MFLDLLGVLLGRLEMQGAFTDLSVLVLYYDMQMINLNLQTSNLLISTLLVFDHIRIFLAQLLVLFIYLLIFYLQSLKLIGVHLF